MANYPKNLAARVYAFLARGGARAPAPEVLDSLIQTLYFASLKTEEGEPVACRIAFADRRDPDPSPPQRVTRDRWQFFALERDLPCTVRNLVKLSKAVDPWSSTLAVDVDSAASLRIWGVIDQGVHHSTFVVQETEAGPRMPGLFQATIEGVGEVAAYKDHAFLGRLRQDVLVTREIGVLQQGPVRDKLLPAIREFQRRAQEAVGTTTYKERGHWDVSLEDEWISALCRVLIGIQRYGHGGAVLLTNSPAAIEPRYAIKYPRLTEALDRLAVAQIRATSLRDLIRRDFGESASDEQEHFMSSRLYLEEAVARNDLDESRCEITGAVRFLSSLGRVDGLVWLGQNLALNGFGVIIGAGRESDNVLRATNAVGTKTQWVDLNNLGTRHRSMIRQCAKDPSSVGFVISQDGDVRAITSIGGSVLVWENIRLQRTENAKGILSRRGAFRIGPTDNQ